MNLSINEQELQDKTKAESKEKVVFRGSNGQEYQIILHDGKPTDEPVSSE